MSLEAVGGDFARSRTHEMARLSTSGASVASLYRDEGEFRRILSDLRVEHAFDAAAVRDLYWKLGAIIGKWISEQQRLEVSTVGKAFLSAAKNLNEVSTLLGGLETGIHSDVEIAVASHAAKSLAIDPTVGSLEKARELVSAFRRDAARMAHVCMVARADLPDQAGERGRRALDWYDDFTALLLDIANIADVKPTMRKNRISGARSGWLFEAAQALESFLYPEMRSPSAEACGTRLERSMRRLRQRARQNSRAG
jgi:hypothetical protein